MAHASSRQDADDFGLRFVSDSTPGFSRRRAGKGFAYFDPGGRRITAAGTIARIRAIVIPPAWTDVWICPSPNGHIQAVGRDTRGRKQYRYHPEWSEKRNLDKFGRLRAFGEKLGRLRARLRADLARRGLPREKVLAGVVRIMEETHIRVGNDEYARANDSYGLTTIRNRHAKVRGGTIEFRFKGKSGIEHASSLRDATLGRIIRRCQDLPGEELFAYVGEDGRVHDVGSADVNDYLREISGEDVTAKIFRTWGASAKAIGILRAMPRPPPGASESDWKKRHCAVIKETAAALGNTQAVCRKYYVHPAIFEADRAGRLPTGRRHAGGGRRGRRSRPSLPGLSEDERILMSLL